MSGIVDPAILIIDDDPDTLDVYRIIFENEGFRVFLAKNSHDAFSVLDKTGIDVALVDLKLGEEDGLSLSEMVMDMSQETKVILFTAYPSFEIAIEATKKGVYYFFEKGKSSEKLVEKVRESITREEIETIKKKTPARREQCLKFITLCRHSLIIEQIINIAKKNKHLEYSKSFQSIKDVSDSKFQKEIDMVIICATCIFPDLDKTFMAMKELYNLFPFIKIIIINDRFNDDEKAQLLKMGIKGFFNSEMDSGKIEKALMSIRNGGIWAERRVLNLAIQPDTTHISKVLAGYENSYALSGREKEVLKTMVLGIRNRDIGDRLYISEKTVKTHINRIFKKLSVDSRVKAILKAKEENLV